MYKKQYITYKNTHKSRSNGFVIKVLTSTCFNHDSSYHMICNI